MKQYFADKRTKIAAFLRDFLSKNDEDFSAIHSLGKDLLQRLFDFTGEGKMLRGALVSLGHDLFKGSSADGMIPIGAALELFQSALLIHDDIMDRDTARRGKRSVHSQYEVKARELSLTDPEHTGESLGVCAGDVAFFLAFELLALAPLSDKLSRAILKLASREMSYVGVAQMMDVYMGADMKQPSVDDVLRLYAYKTGRYTFSLPLMAGGIAAGATLKALSIVEKLGVYLGTIFQIKDDEIGLFGNATVTGKSIGSDVKEGKKTLYYLFLAGLKDRIEYKKALSFFGDKSVTESEIFYIRDILTSSGIPEKIREILKSLEEQTYGELRKLNGVDAAARDILSQFIEYNIQRSA